MERSKLILALVCSVVILTSLSSFVKRSGTWKWIGTDDVNNTSLYEEIVVSKLHPGVQSLKVEVDKGQVRLKGVKINYLAGDTKLIQTDTSLMEEDHLIWNYLTANKRLIKSVELWYDSPMNPTNRVHLYGK